MLDTLRELKKKHYVALVGGSDYVKIVEQIGEDICKEMDFCFSENGLFTLKNGKPFAETSIADKVGNEKLNVFLNFCLHYLSTIDIPIKRYIVYFFIVSY